MHLYHMGKGHQLLQHVRWAVGAASPAVFRVVRPWFASPLCRLLDVAFCPGVRGDGLFREPDFPGGVGVGAAAVGSGAGYSAGVSHGNRRVADSCEKLGKKGIFVSTLRPAQPVLGSAHP